jgi:hypothetical protein
MTDTERIGQTKEDCLFCFSSYLLLRWLFLLGTDRTCKLDLSRTSGLGGKQIRAIFLSGTRRNEDRRNVLYHTACLPCIYPNSKEENKKIN